MYALMNIVGPLLLLAALIFFTLRTWKRRPREDAISEQAAKRLREDLNEEDQRRGSG